MCFIMSPRLAILSLAVFLLDQARCYECPGYGRFPDTSIKGCRHYVVCTKTTDGHDMTLRFTCPEDQVFDPKEARCVDDFLYLCPDLIADPASNLVDGLQQQEKTADESADVETSTLKQEFLNILKSEAFLKMLASTVAENPKAFASLMSGEADDTTTKSFAEDLMSTLAKDTTTKDEAVTDEALNPLVPDIGIPSEITLDSLVMTTKSPTMPGSATAVSGAIPIVPPVLNPQVAFMNQGSTIGIDALQSTNTLLSTESTTQTTSDPKDTMLNPYFTTGTDVFQPANTSPSTLPTFQTISDPHGTTLNPDITAGTDTLPSPNNLLTISTVHPLSGLEGISPDSDYITGTNALLSMNSLPSTITTIQPITGTSPTQFSTTTTDALISTDSLSSTFPTLQTISDSSLNSIPTTDTLISTYTPPNTISTIQPTSILPNPDSTTETGVLSSENVIPSTISASQSDIPDSNLDTITQIIQEEQNDFNVVVPSVPIGMDSSTDVVTTQQVLAAPHLYDPMYYYPYTKDGKLRVQVTPYQTILSKLEETKETTDEIVVDSQTPQITSTSTDVLPTTLTTNEISAIPNTPTTASSDQIIKHSIFNTDPTNDMSTITTQQSTVANTAFPTQSTLSETTTSDQKFFPIDVSLSNPNAGTLTEAETTTAQTKPLPTVPFILPIQGDSLSTANLAITDASTDPSITPDILTTMTTNSLDDQSMPQHETSVFLEWSDMLVEPKSDPNEISSTLNPEISTTVDKNHDMSTPFRTTISNVFGENIYPSTLITETVERSLLTTNVPEPTTSQGAETQTTSSTLPEGPTTAYDIETILHSGSIVDTLLGAPSLDVVADVDKQADSDVLDTTSTLFQLTQSTAATVTEVPSTTKTIYFSTSDSTTDPQVASSLTVEPLQSNLIRDSTVVTPNYVEIESFQPTMDSRSGFTTDITTHTTTEITPTMTHLTSGTPTVSTTTHVSELPSTASEPTTTSIFTTDASTISSFPDATTSSVSSTTQTTTSIPDTTITTTEPTTTTIETTTTEMTSSSSPTFVCTSSGRFPDMSSSDCKGYIFCVQLDNGEFLQFKFACLEDSAFDPFTQRCTTEYVCPQMSTTTMLPTIEITTVISQPQFLQPQTFPIPTTTARPFMCSSIGRYPDPTDVSCSNYVMCISSPFGGFIQYNYRCLAPYYFNPYLGECSLSYVCHPPVMTSTQPTPMTIGQQFTCTSAGRYPDYNSPDCKRYVLCSPLPDGSYTQHYYDCAGDTVFNPYTKTCDVNYQCQKVSLTTPSTYAIQTTSPAPTFTDSTNSFVCTSTGRFLDPTATDCSRYILCMYTTTMGFIQYRFTCQPNSRFDPLQRVCSNSYVCPPANTQYSWSNIRASTPQKQMPAPPPPTTVATTTTTTPPPPTVSFFPSKSVRFQSTVTMTTFVCRTTGRFEDHSVPGCKGYVLCVRNEDGSLKPFYYSCFDDSTFDPNTMLCSNTYVCPYA